MSWSASPSRPAPPITSTSPDSLFVSSSSRSNARPGLRAGGGASGSSASSSSSSSSTSAISLLTKQKAEFEDDRASIRSGRTSRNTSFSSSPWSRQRSTSTATLASVNTTTSSRTVIHTPSSRANSGCSGSHELSIKAQGKQKQTKTTVDVCEPSSDEQPERSSSRESYSLRADKRPRLVQKSSNSTVASSTIKTTNHPPRPSSAAQISHKSSWLWRSGDSKIPPSPSEALVRSGPEISSPAAMVGHSIAMKSSDSIDDASMDGSSLSSSAASSTNSQVFHTPDPSPKKPIRRVVTEPASISQQTRKGWFGSATPAELGELKAQRDSMDREDEDAQSKTLKNLAGKKVIEGESDRTPRTSRLPLPVGAPAPQSGASQTRSVSWFGWGGETEPEKSAIPTKTDQPEKLESPDVDDDEGIRNSGVDAKLASKSDETLRTPRPSSDNKSWLRTIWGEGATVASTDASSSTPADDADSVRDEAPSMPTPIASERLSDVQQPIAVPVRSWFGRRQGDGSAQTPSTAASSLNLPPSMLAAARSGSGLASSATSVRTNESTTDKSAPSSPRLGPQPHNAPVKPLTGSIRSSSSPRVGPFEPDPPFENLILPTFQDTFNRLPRSRKVEKSKLTKAVSVVSAYFFHQPPPLEILVDKPVRDDPAANLPKSLEVMEEPSRLGRVKRVVTIGVHGWFPNPRLKSIFGEPTGTSVKFATMMHDAVHSYLVDHDMASFNIQAIALDGQGEVDARVDKHLNQILDREEWVAALRSADAVFLATHSQGTVVSTQLLARLLDRGIIVGSKTHMLAMCGIAQGPFVYLSQSFVLTPYFNYLESAPARELFEFQNPDSVQTIKFLESLRIVLAHGIKITATGSINDQVVPLYSALFSGITHPGILRAVYIDSQAFRTSDFLANLVVFAARLRNAGLHDHDLIYHVSEALAGALTGVGHSKIYEEDEVYMLATRYHFETTSLFEPPTSLESPPNSHLHLHLPSQTPNHKPTSTLRIDFNPRDRRNPYLLTWALRGIIEDPKVRDLFANELQALREAFESWRPVSKALKEVRLKLEPIRMLPRVSNTMGKL